MEQGFAVLLIVLVVFLLIREFWTWYFKLNEIVSQLRNQNEFLKEQNDTLRRQTYILGVWAQQQGVSLPTGSNNTESEKPDRTDSRAM